MYTLLVTGFFVSRKRSRRAASGQHTICLNKLLAFLSNHCADRFLLWWLFLHRRLRPRQRGSSCDERLLLYFPVVPCRKAFSVFIRKTVGKKFFNSFLSEQSLSASMQGVNSNFFPSFVTLKRCVTAPLASPCTGQKPVSIFDCRMDSTRKNFLVNRQIKRKYLRFCPYFTGFFRAVCGKLCASPVEKTVENHTSGFNLQFNNFSVSKAGRKGLCKTKKAHRKNFFYL